MFAEVEEKILMRLADNWLTKMMQLSRYTFLFYLFLLLTLTTNAQQTKWGKVNTATRDSYIEKFIGLDANGYTYTLRRNTDLSEFEDNPEFKIEKFDPELNLVYTKKLDLPKEDTKEHQFEGIEIANGRIVLFTSFHHQNEQRNIAYITNIDENGMLENIPTEVDFIITKKLKNLGSFHFALSCDSSKVLVFHQEPKKYELSFKKTLPQTYNKKLFFKLLDNSYNTLWERKLEFPYHEDDFQAIDVYLDPKENLHILAEVNEKKDKWLKNRPDPDYSLFTFDSSNNKLKEFALKFENKKISSLSFRPLKTGEMIFAGFYDEDDPLSQTQSITGVFLLKIKPLTNEVISQGIIVFPGNIISEFIGNKKADKGKKISDFTLNHIIDLSNGDIIVLAEEYYTDVTCYIDQRTGLQTCHDNYYYNDIMVMNFALDGSIKWIKKIPKQQQSINDYGIHSSYLPFRANNNVHFLFNENPQNLSEEDKAKDKVMSNPKRSVIANVKIDLNGDISVSHLGDEKKDQDQIFIPKIHKTIRPSEIIVLGVKKNEFKLGKINY